MFTPDAFAVRVAALFAEQPDEWTATGYRASHGPSKVEVWIANQAYGLAVNLPGGLTIYGGQCVGDHASRGLIWRAFKQWRQARALSVIALASQDQSKADDQAVLDANKAAMERADGERAS